MTLGKVLVLAWLAAVALRGLVASRTPLGPDGAVELAVARAFAEGRFADGLDLHFHPLFSAGLALLARLLGVDPAGPGLETLARVVAPLVSALVAPLLAWAAATLARVPRGTPWKLRSGEGWGPGPLRAAAVVGLVAAAQPALVRQGGQVLAYGTAHAALALALALAVRTALRPGASGAAGVGLAVGLGWTARSDGLATGAGLFVALLLAALRAPGPARARRTVGVGLALGLGLALGMAPYGVAMRLHAGEWRLSLKKRLDAVVRLPDASPLVEAPPALDLAPVGPERPLPLHALVRLELQGGDLVEAVDAAPGRPPPWFALRKIESAAHPLLLGLALLLLVLRPRQGEAGSWPPGVHAVWCVPLLVWWVVHTLLKLNVGYTSDVHTSAAGVLVSLPAGWALVLLGRRLSAVGGRSTPWRGRSRDATRVLLGAALLLLVPKAIALQRGPYAVEREVGRRLRDEAGPGPLLIAGHDGRVVAHYADATWVDLPTDAAPNDAVEALRAQGVRLLVFVLRRRASSSDASPGAPRLHQALVAAGAVPLAPTPSASKGDLRYDWALYRIPERHP